MSKPNFASQFFYAGMGGDGRGESQAMDNAEFSSNEKEILQSKKYDKVKTNHHNKPEKNQAKNCNSPLQKKSWRQSCIVLEN